MHPHPLGEFIHPLDIPLIDRGFDRFELNTDLEANLREAEVATFYHDTFDPEE